MTSASRHSRPAGARTSALATLLLLTAAIVLTAGPRGARASAQDIYGYGTRGPSMAGATISLARGFEAVYYNPAGLAATRGLYSIGVGYQLTSYNLSLDSPAFAGASAETRALVDAAQNVDTVGGLTIGAALFIPMRGVMERRIAIGFGFYIPNEVIIRAKIPRPYTPRFAVVDRANVVAIQLAGAVRITDWLRIGGGFKALAALAGKINIQPNELGTLGSDVEDELVVNYSEIFGIQIEPTSWLRLGVTYRGPFIGRFKLPIDADLGPQFGSLLGIPTLNIEGIAQYDPRQVQVGVSGSPIRGLWIELAIGWEQWSSYEQPIKAAVACVPCDPSKHAWCNASNPTAHCMPELPSTRFEDTVSVRVGGEYTFPISRSAKLDGVARVGYRYQPSPVPDQQGLDNFLDSTRHVFAAGVAARWKVAPDMTLVVALHFQLHVMVARQYDKSTDWPPRGTSADDYEKIKRIAGDIDFRPFTRSSGRLFSGGGAVSLEF